ncbi:MAG: hypothetical protein K5930_11825 [Treponemataceae bacterium]|nr:hypothetical protein [Treponemataceae bacterium]
MYRDYGPLRNIRKVLRENSLDASLYASWSRWSRKHDWKKRAEAYDDHAEKIRLLIQREEEEERRRAYQRMLSKVTRVVDERLDKLRAEELTANQTMDFLERSYELGTRVSGLEGEDKGKSGGQLEITFTDAFDGV